MYVYVRMRISAQPDRLDANLGCRQTHGRRRNLRMKSKGPQTPLVNYGGSMVSTLPQTDDKVLVTNLSVGRRIEFDYAHVRSPGK